MVTKSRAGNVARPPQDHPVSGLPGRRAARRPRAIIGHSAWMSWLLNARSSVGMRTVVCTARAMPLLADRRVDGCVCTGCCRPHQELLRQIAVPMEGVDL